MNFDAVGDADVPMLKLFESMHPVASLAMVFVTFLMIYNTTISMFYALGRRMTVNHRKRYVPVFLGICVLGYVISLVGFGTLMSVVYPVIGYVGMVLVVVMFIWWFRNREAIGVEAGRRTRIRALMTKRGDETKEFTAYNENQLRDATEESPADNEALTGAMEVQVKLSLIHI